MQGDVPAYQRAARQALLPLVSVTMPIFLIMTLAAELIVPLLFGEQWLASIPLYQGHNLTTGQHLVGPAVVVQPDTTIFLAAGDDLYVDSYRNLVIEVNLARSHKP